jgi:hypothetical protein
MGLRHSEQASLWVATSELPKSPWHPTYTRLNSLLDAHSFDRFIEHLCAGLVTLLTWAARDERDCG